MIYEKFQQEEPNFHLNIRFIDSKRFISKEQKIENIKGIFAGLEKDYSDYLRDRYENYYSPLFKRK